MTFPALWKHQADFVQRSLGGDSLGLWWDVGTGKSRATIDAMRHQFAKRGRIMRTVILCPRIVCTNWEREIALYSKIHKWDVHVLLGSGAIRNKAFLHFATDDQALTLTKPQIFITNYEGLLMDPLFANIKKWRPELVIADEAHRIKNPESKRAKKTIELSDISQLRYALTGTPVLRNGMDIFNLYRFLDRGETFGKNFFVFRSKWFEDKNATFAGKPNYFPNWQPRVGAYEEFNRLVYKRASRAIKSECLDLPPFVRKEIRVELSPEQKKLYKQMKDDYIAFIDSKETSEMPKAVVAQLAITKALRLQQIVTGYAKTEDGEIHKIKSNPRLEALEELLEDLTPGSKVIVWSVFHENYADIAAACARLKIGYRELHGQVSNKERDPNIRAFREDPDVRVLIANQAAGGIGINLIESDVAVFYSRNFSLEQDLQAEGRNYRGGSERHQSVTRIDLVAPDTIDELISEALINKQDISNRILEIRDRL